jgi:hypothetical protein
MFALLFTPCPIADRSQTLRAKKNRSRSVVLVLGSDEGGERAAGLVGCEQVAEVGEQRAVL